MSRPASSAATPGREPQAVLADMGVSASFDNLLSFSFGDLQTILGAVLTKLDENSNRLAQVAGVDPELEARVRTLEAADMVGTGERLKLIEDKIQDAEWAKSASDGDAQAASEGVSTKIRHVEEQLEKRMADLEAELNAVKANRSATPAPRVATPVTRTTTPGEPSVDKEALRVLELKVQDLTNELQSMAEKDAAKADLKIEGDKADFDTLEKYTKRFCSILEKDVRKNRESISELASEMGSLNSQQELKHNHTSALADRLNTDVGSLQAWKDEMDKKLAEIVADTKDLNERVETSTKAHNDLKDKVDRLPTDVAASHKPALTLPLNTLCILGKDGTIEQWGESGFSVTGVNDATGQSVFDKVIPLPQKARIVTLLESVFAGNATVTESIPFASANGGTIDVDVDFRPVMDIAMLKVLSCEVKQCSAPKEKILTTDKAGHITLWSDFAYELTGVPSELAMGQEWADFIDPDTKLDAENIVHKANVGKLTFDHTVSFMDKDGLVSTVTAVCHPNRVANSINGFTLVGSRQGVTIHRTDRGNGGGLQDDVELFSLNPDGKVRDWNAQSVAMTGIPSEQVVGKSLVEDILDEASREEVKGFLFPSVEREEEEDPQLLAELSLVSEDGKKIPMNVALAFDRDQTGKIVSIIARFVSEHLVRLRKDIRKVQDDMRGVVGAELSNFVTQDRLDQVLKDYQPAVDENLEHEVSANRSQIASLQEKVSALSTSKVPSRNSSFKTLDLGNISDGDAHGVKQALALLESRQLDLETMLEQKAARQQAENLKRTIDDLFSSLLQLKARVDDAFGKNDRSDEQERLLTVVREQIDPLEQRLVESEASIAKLTTDKASWSELNLILEDKANTSDLGAKANRSYAEALFERVNNFVHTEIKKLQDAGDSEGTQAELERLALALETKANNGELDELRHDVHLALERAGQPTEDSAAGARSALVHNYRCLSCDKFLPVLVSKPMHASHTGNMPPQDPDSMTPKIHFQRHKFHQTPPATPTSNYDKSSPRGGRTLRSRGHDFDASPPRHRPHTVYATPASGLSHPPRSAGRPDAVSFETPAHPPPHPPSQPAFDVGPPRPPIEPPPDPYKKATA